MVVQRKLLVGDTIKCKGVESVIGKILSQSTFIGSSSLNQEGYYDIEFEDKNGVYRSWKSYLDGGTVILNPNAENYHVTYPY